MRHKDLPHRCEPQVVSRDQLPPVPLPVRTPEHPVNLHSPVLWSQMAKDSRRMRLVLSETMEEKVVRIMGTNGSLVTTATLGHLPRISSEHLASPPSPSPLCTPLPPPTPQPLLACPAGDQLVSDVVDGKILALLATERGA